MKIQLTLLLEKWREYDEQNSGNLRKYWYFSIVVVLCWVSLNLIIDIIFMFIAIILGAIWGISLGILRSEKNNSGLPIITDVKESDEEAIKTANRDIESQKAIRKFLGYVLFYSTVMYAVGEFLIGIFSVSFPVLLDIKWQTDWININFMYIIRTFLNIVQFLILFYITRRIRKRLKKKVLDAINYKGYDHYDTKFFEPTI